MTTTRPTFWASWIRAEQEQILSEVERPLRSRSAAALRRGDRRRADDHPHGDRADTATAGQALEEIRRQAEEVEDFYQVFVVDDEQRLIGTLPFKDLVISRPERPVRAFMADADIFVTPDLDQEDVARLMARYNMPSVPVVNEQGRLLGRVTFDDVIDVVEAETTEDLLKFGGVSPDEGLGAGWKTAVQSRLPWLSINLATAFLAGGVVYFFQHTIQRTVALAVWMPIIAGMGGNAGTQALAVTVRRLALGLIPVNLFAQVVGKEILVGIINGLVMGLERGRRGDVHRRRAPAGGRGLPRYGGESDYRWIRRRLHPHRAGASGIDPAVASSIFVTTFTDVCGFLLLLGLAGGMLL